MTGRVGPYEVLATLGEGGAGVVLRARAPTGALVAIKLLRTRSKPDALARFERERRLQGALGESEGFVPLLGAGESEAGPYLVLPLLEGGTLRDRLDRGPLSPEETLALGRTLAGTLALAHERGIVHRDLKPENVIYTADGRPLVADLGLAKHFDLEAEGASRSNAGISRSGAFRGTPQYMAPEQMEDSREAQPSADVYALGAILWECLVGRPPHQAKDVIELIARVQKGGVEPVRAHAPGVPRWLANVVERCLSREPRDRYEDARALALALDAKEAGPAKGRALRALGLALALGAAGTGVGLLLRRPSPPAADDRRGDERKAEALALARRAAERLDAGETPAALELDRAIDLDPGLARAWTNRGEARLLRNDPDGAAADLERAVALDPRDARAHGVRAFVATQRPDPPLAAREAARALELDPDDLHALFARAACPDPALGREAARAAADRASRTAPQRALTWIARALVAARDDRSEESLAHAKRATDLEPRYVLAWIYRASLERDARADAAGIASADRAIALDPRSPGAYALRAQLRVLAGDLAGGSADADRAIEVGPRCSTAWIAHALLAPAGERARMLADLDRALEIAPRSRNARGTRAVAREGAGDLAGARADVDLALADSPGDSGLQEQRARIARDQGDLVTELEAARAAVEALPGSAEATLELARAVAATDPEAARPTYERALALGPRSTEVLSGVAWFHYTLEETEAATRDARAAVAIDSQDSLARSVLLLVSPPPTAADRAAEAAALVKLAPRLAAAHFARGITLGASPDPGDQAVARDELARAAELDPIDPSPRLARAALDLRRGEPPRSASELLAALRARAPRHPAVLAFEIEVAARLGDLDRAERAANVLVAVAPRAPLGWTRRGLIQRSRGDPRGLLDLDKAVELAPDRVESWVARGGYALQECDSARAVDSAEHVLALAPGHPGAASILAMVAWQHEHDAAKALAILERAAALAPDDEELLAAKEVVLDETGRSAEAEAIASRQIERRPDRPEGWGYRALAVAAADPAKAREYLDRVNSLAPGSLLGAQIEIALGEPGKALARAEKALAADPGRRDAIGLRGYALLHQGDVAGAGQAADTVVAKWPHIESGWFLRGLVRAARGEDAAALEDLEKGYAIARPGGPFGTEGVAVLEKLRKSRGPR